MMDILMFETCRAHKWNKIASDIKLVFHSSTITMMHGPINIKGNAICVKDGPHETTIYIDVCYPPLLAFREVCIASLALSVCHTSQYEK